MRALGLRRGISLTTLTALFLLFSLLLAENAFAALISVNPTQGPPGSAVTVNGSQWPPSDRIELSWNFPPFNTVATVQADGNGAFTTVITVPPEAPIGPTRVNAINEAGDITWQAEFEVTVPSPTHAAFAYGPVARIATYGTGTNPVRAQTAAESACIQQGGSSDCQGVGWWKYGYASFALSATTDDWGWATDPNDITIADSKALRRCDANCSLIYRLGIGESPPYEWSNLSPVDGEWTVEGYVPGQGDHTGRDQYAVDFFSDDPAVYPVRPGEVVFSDWNCQTVSGNPPCYGNTVAVDHGDGIYSIYTHLAEDGMATLGEQVTPQTRIGIMSNSGCPVSICGSRPHLHFAVRSGPPDLGANALFGSNTPILTPWTP